MKTDRELLEAAANAAGLMFHDWSEETEEQWAMLHGQFPVLGREDEYPTYWTETCWNSIVYPEDMHHLETRLQLSVLQYPACVEIGWPHRGLPARLVGAEPVREPVNDKQNRTQAMGRALTRAAAAIWEAKQKEC